MGGYPPTLVSDFLIGLDDALPARIERERVEGELQYPRGYCSREGERAGTAGSQRKPAT